ncbi:MAG: sugar kinase [Oscillospiraceae bacterium]|nr:sugar kinase [Oscillospiraceae bacterium]
MKTTVCFGDLMLSLTPPGYYRFIQSDTVQMFFTGAESNVAASLAQFGMATQFVTRLPAHAIGEAAEASLRKYNIGTAFIQKGGDRIGVIYTERGASQRPSAVIYDRANSSFSTSPEGCYDWDAIFAGADWFHTTGITPALSDGLAAITLEACRKAKEAGLTVSCDLNYRKKLWTTEKAGRVMRQILPYVDVLIANEEDAEKVLGMKAGATDVTRGELEHAGYVDVARQIHGEFGIPYIATTLRKSLSASDNDWSAMLWHDGKAYFSKTYSIHIVNRVGGGDSFSGGLIYGFKQGLSLQDTLEFATAASCLKHSIEQDYNLVSAEQVLTLMNGDGSGRVQR